jgi:hypothetical protein
VGASMGRDDNRMQCYSVKILQLPDENFDRRTLALNNKVLIIFFR